MERETESETTYLPRDTLDTCDAGDVAWEILAILCDSIGTGNGVMSDECVRGNDNVSWVNCNVCLTLMFQLTRKSSKHDCSVSAVFIPFVSHSSLPAKLLLSLIGFFKTLTCF